MKQGNNSLAIKYHWLSEADLPDAHRTFLEAYADYFVPLQMTVGQFENHLVQNNVNWQKSVGAFIEEKMIGLTLNGFGIWNGKQTAYDAGTGVIPSFRNHGAGRGMFEFAIPELKKKGIEQVLLEVITKNERAINLYRSIGFETTRRLIYYERKAAAEKIGFDGFKIAEIENPDWNLLKTFGGIHSSWQNSLESFARNLTRKIILGAFDAEKCIGYGLVYCNSGTVLQIAVAENYRQKGVGGQILEAMQKCVGGDKNLKFSNVDENLIEFNEFLKKCGFRESLRQFEMVKIL